MKNKICVLLLLLISSHSFAQQHNFDYQREIMGINEAWHKLELPNEIFGKISPKLNDIRIIGITAQNDSIEAPYLLHSTEDLIKNTAIDFKLLNQSRDKNGYYFTFKLPTANTINQIQLNFEQENFDWNIRLEGSQNQQNWYTLIEDYRILSIKNAHTNYQFSKLNFPDANYSFYRVLINSKEKPKLKNATLSLQEIVTGKSRKYAINKTNTFENKKLQQSELNIDMGAPVLINNIKITVNENFDYYRPIHIQYVTNSTKTETGWIYNYQTLTSGTLSSIEKNEFQFNNTLAQHVKIIIRNSDNEALTISNVEIEGSIYELLIRFSKPAKYFLCYGNRNAHKPNYDIARFTENVPKSISAISLGDEESLRKRKLQKIGRRFL